jgi:subtilisin family serine protease
VVAVIAITASAQASARGDAPARLARPAPIADEYIVVLKGALPIEPTQRSEKEAKADDERVASSVGATPLYEYDADLKGFAAHLTGAQLRRLRHSTLVKYVEHVQRVVKDAARTQTNPPWDLDRIDQQALPLDSTYHYASAGAGVSIFVVDTGIQAENPDFGSRASLAFNAIDNQHADRNGHGTFVAGLAGGTQWGVAKHAKLVGVKVLGPTGSGTTASVIYGINWVTEHHVRDKSVALVSLGGGASPAMDTAVTRLVESGVFVSSPAGNDNKNACNYSPSRAPAVFTVAASDLNDRKASFSNSGPCVDAYAPGVSVTSDWITGKHNTLSGTSMAAGIVAGIAALYLADHASTPADTTTWILDHATADVIHGNPVGTANRLVYTDGL